MTQSHGGATYGSSNSGGTNIVTVSNGLLVPPNIKPLFLTPRMLGLFGQGKVALFTATGPFLIPAGVTQIRVTCIGAGGGGSVAGQTNVANSEGGASYTYLLGGDNTQLVTANGGKNATTATGGAGGIATVGDILFTGGAGGVNPGSGLGGSGGGAVATPLGVGGKGGDLGTATDGSKAVEGLYSTGGASGNARATSATGTPFGPRPAKFPGFCPSLLGNDYLYGTRISLRAKGRFGTDVLCGGDGAGGDQTAPGAGGGGGGYLSGGESGYGVANTNYAYCGGNGGIGGGGGGGAGGPNGPGYGGGGGSCAIKVLTVTPSTSYQMVVGNPGGAGYIMPQTAGYADVWRGGWGGTGLILVEW